MLLTVRKMQYLLQSCSRGRGGGMEDMCYEWRFQKISVNFFKSNFTGELFLLWSVFSLFQWNVNKCSFNMGCLDRFKIASSFIFRIHHKNGFEQSDVKGLGQETSEPSWYDTDCTIRGWPGGQTVNRLFCFKCSICFFETNSKQC